MNKEMYFVTLFDAAGDWVDRDEDHVNYASARAYAEANTPEGGHSTIQSVELIERITWTRKFKTTAS